MNFGSVFLSSFAGVFALVPLAFASAPDIEQTITVPRIDGSPLQLFVGL